MNTTLHLLKKRGKKEEGEKALLGMTKWVEELLLVVGEDPTREGLQKTPQRFLKAFSYFNHGYKESIEKIVNGAIYEALDTGTVLVQNIEFYSLCEHHLVPFFGTCHVAYSPDKKIIGLSKIPRIVNVFARRLQVQERLTQEIADCLMKLIKPKGVGVIIEANHLCMMMRGVEKKLAQMKTTTFKGSFSSPANRAELLAMIR